MNSPQQKYKGQYDIQGDKVITKLKPSRMKRIYNVNAIKEERFEIHNNYDYLNFIKKNHMIIQTDIQKRKVFKKMSDARMQQPKSTREPKSQDDHYLNNSILKRKRITNMILHDEQQYLENSSNNDRKVFIHPSQTNRYDGKISLPKKHSKIGEDNEVQDEKLLTYDMIMQIMHVKNQQIAESLMRQRQSMSDVIYPGPKSYERLPNNSKGKKYIISHKLIHEPLLKFPQLIKKKISYGTVTTLEKKIQEQKTIKEKMEQFDQEQQKEKAHGQDYRSLDGQRNRKNNESSEGRINQEMIKAYHRNILKIKEQPYNIIPEFQPPKKKKDRKQQKKMKEKKVYDIYKSGQKNETNELMKNQLKQFLESKIMMTKNEQEKDQLFDKLRDMTFPICNSKIEEGNLKQILLESDQEIQTNLKEKVASELPKQQSQIKDYIQQNPQDPTLSAVQSLPKLTKKTSLFKNKSKINFLASEKQKDSNIYQGKIRSYREFLFQMNLVHRKFDALLLKQQQSIHRVQTKYRFYVGKGNNSLLINSLMQRRFWWVPEQDPKKANFVWTQLKLNHYYQFQPKSYLENPYDKLQNIQQISEGEAKLISKKSKTLKKKQSQCTSPAKVAKVGSFKAPLPQGLQKIMTKLDEKIYKEFMQNSDYNKISVFQNRLKYFPESLLKPSLPQKTQLHMHNHFEFNYFIGNKKALYYNLKHYYTLINKDLGEIIPLTFHIQKGTSDPQYQKFFKEFKKIKQQAEEDKERRQRNLKKKKDEVFSQPSKNVWIVKPGQNSNRGMGITVIEQVYELNNILKKKQKHKNGQDKTYIIQKYIEKPMLYNRRKFDIRHYMVVSRLHGRMRAYWYGEGYIRTSCYEYDIQEIDNEYMHLTNDAIQKEAEKYGKYEQANKISYNEFQRYLDSNFPDKKYSFAEQVYPRMRQIALDAFKATYLKMDPNCYENNFQVFGLDFMIDGNFKTYLIEVNTNPCLEINCTILNRIIPTMLEHCFRMTLDVVYPPPNHYPNTVKYLCPDNPLQRLQYELIFDEARDGKEIWELYENGKELLKGSSNIDDVISSDDEIYENDGKELDFDGDLE